MVLHHLLSGDLPQLPPLAFAPMGGDPGSKSGMRLSLHVPLILSAALAAAPAIAADKVVTAGTVMTFGAETIATSNVLDDESELGDSALHLRGSIAHETDTDLGAFRLTTGFDVTRYRRYDFADDSLFSIEAQHEIELAKRWTLRTSAGYSAADEGDDLNLGLLRLATRQTTQRYHVAGTLGLKLSDDILATLTVSDRYDAVGDARFQLPLPDTRLTPDRNAVNVALSLAAVRDGVQYAVVAEASDVGLHHQVPFQNAVPFETFALRGRIVLDDQAGWALSGEIGVRELRGDLGIFDEARPVYALSISRKFLDRLTLKAGIDCDFDTDDTDDPLGTYWRRVSVEGAVKLSESLEAGAGAFIGIGENLLLENEERDRGLYGAVAYAFNSRLSLLLRVDYVRKRYTIVHLEHETLTARFGFPTLL